MLISTHLWGGESTILAESHYGVLGVQPTATFKEIRKAYLSNAKLLHPDKNPDDKEQANQRFKALGQAYDRLSDETSRAAYDEELAHELRQSIYTRDRKMAETIDPNCMDTLVSQFYVLLRLLKECCR